jgi:hypothetical protein
MSFDANSAPPTIDEPASSARPVAPPKRTWGMLAVIALVGCAALLFLFARADHSSTSPTSGTQITAAAPPPVAPPPGPAAAPAIAPGASPDAATSDDVTAIVKHSIPSLVAAPARGYAPPQRGKAAAPQAEKSASPPPAKADPPKREIDCSSPYFIDDQGMKKIRPECL